MNSVLSTNERPDPHCEESSLSNLVKLRRHTRQDNSITETSCLVNPPSRNQRCFSQFDRKTDCFDGGEIPRTERLSVNWLRGESALNKSTNGPAVSEIRGASATFKTVCGTQSRMPEGFNLIQIQALSTPDNLVGGAVMRTIPTASRGLNLPTKGEGMSKLTGEQDDNTKWATRKITKLCRCGIENSCSQGNC